MITVSLSVGELIFDIQNKTYLTGRSREAADASSYETAANMQVSDDDENLYQLRRSLTAALAELNTTLAEYVEGAGEEAGNNLHTQIETNGSLNLKFNVPTNFNSNILPSATQAIHQYLVSRCISDWFLITNRTESETYATVAKQALDQVRRLMHKRVRPVKNKQSNHSN